MNVSHTSHTLGRHSLARPAAIAPRIPGKGRTEVDAVEGAVHERLVLARLEDEPLRAEPAVEGAPPGGEEVLGEEADHVEAVRVVEAVRALV